MKEFKAIYKDCILFVNPGSFEVTGVKSVFFFKRLHKKTIKPFLKHHIHVEILRAGKNYLLL